MRALTMSRNPIVQVFSLLIIGMIAIGAVVMGAVILAIVLGVGMLAAIVIALRVWWIRRKLRRASPADTAVIEADYRVVQQRDLREHERRD